MSIKIKRNTGWLGSLADFRLIINGETIDRIRSSEAVEIGIPTKEASVQVSYFGSKSNQLKVQSGDKLEITTTRWWKFNLFLVTFIIAGVMLIPEMQLRLISTFLVLTIFYTLHYFDKGMNYKLSIVKSEKEMKNRYTNNREDFLNGFSTKYLHCHNTSIIDKLHKL